MLTDMTAAGVFRPFEKKLALYYDAALIIGGSIFIALSAQIAIWLPFSPVPVTGQTFAVLTAGTLLGSRRGGLCVLMYLAQGAAGLPVFAAGRSGLAVLFGPTGGYLFGFLAAAYVTGLLAENGWDRRFLTTIAAMTLGSICIYTFGLLWLSLLMGTRAVLMTGLYPFIAGEIFKIWLAGALLPSGWKILQKLKKNP